MTDNRRSKFVVSGRKGATAAAVVLAVILSLAIGAGASWFFLAGAQAQAREALRQIREERQRQSRLALAQLQQEVQVSLEKAAKELERLNYGSGTEQLQEAIDKCDLVMSALASEDQGRAGLLRQGLEEAKSLARAGDATAVQRVKSLRAESVASGALGAGPQAPSAPPQASSGGKEMPVAPPESPAPVETPRPEEEQAQTTTGEAAATTAESQNEVQPPAPPPFAP